LRRRRLERSGIIEISGGGKELLCDTCEAAGVELPELTPAGAKALEEAMANPEYVATNPVDTGGAWVMPEKARVYPATLEIYASGPRALGRLAEYSRFVHGPAEANGAPHDDGVGAGVPLDEVESKKILAAAGIPVVESRLAATADEASEIANSVGYPVVLKLI